MSLTTLIQSVNLFHWKRRAQDAEALAADRLNSLFSVRAANRRALADRDDHADRLRVVLKEADDANRALSLERAAHQVTAERLATALSRLEETTRQKGECWAELIETQTELGQALQREPLHAEPKEEAAAP